MDMDYFQSLLQSKLAGTGSYQEQMAAQQQSQDFDAEEELSNALAEIRKNEKDFSIIAMMAQTLIERNNDLQDSVNEHQIKLDRFVSSETASASHLQSLHDEVEQLRLQNQKLERIKDDQNNKMKMYSEKKKRAENSLVELRAKLESYQESDLLKDQQHRDREAQLISKQRELQSMLDIVQAQLDKTDLEFHQLE